MYVMFERQLHKHHVYSPNESSPNVDTPNSCSPTYIEIYTFPDQLIEMQGSPTDTNPDQGMFIFILIKHRQCVLLIYSV